MLESLTPAQWDAPTLCAGWRVREVAAHMSFGFRFPLPRMVLELVKARGDINRMADRRARQDAAALSTAALGHDVIHGLDIAVALGLDRRVPEERVRLLLEQVTPRTLKFFGADLGGVELRADDLDWSFGTGTVLTGAAQDLLLVTYGRKLPPGRLHGTARDRYAAT